MNNHSSSARLHRLEYILARFSLYAASLALAALACAAMWQVIARFILHIPQSWSEVLARTLMIWAAFLAIGGSYHRGVMIAVDVVRNLAPASLHRILEAVIFVANIGVLSTLVWNGALMARRVSGQKLAGMDVSIAWGYAAIPTGCFIALLIVILRFVLRDTEVEQAPEVY